MPTKVKIKGLNADRLTKRVKTRIGRAIKKSDAEEQVVEALVEEIRDKGIKPGLERSTIENRRRLAQYNRTHPDYRAAKSNLTFSGQLLDALRSLFSVSRLSFTIRANRKKHTPPLTKKGRRTKVKGGAPTNEDILKYQSDMGREITKIFGRSRFRKKVVKIIKRAIKDAIERDN